MSKKYDFSFNLSNLAPYTDELSSEIMRKAILEGETTKIANVVPGVKGTQQLNYLDSVLYPQSAACGFNASGSTIFQARDLTTYKFKIDESLCLEDLEQFYLGKLLSAGANYDSPGDMSFESVIVDLKKAQISQSIENYIWNSTSGGTLGGFSGFKELISSNTPGVVNVPGASALTSTNALTEIDKIIAQLPVNISHMTGQIKIFLSYQQFRTYLVALRNANYFNFTYTDADFKNLKIYHPGTDIQLIALPGLTYANSNRIVMGLPEYMHVGVDLLGDSDSLRLWFSMDFNEVRMQVKYRIGTQISWPEYWVSNNLA